MCFTSVHSYWINFQNIYTFTYQKSLLHTLLLLLFKIVESLQCILSKFPFDAQFNYCLLILIHHSRQSNKKIKQLQDVLRLIQNDKLPSYEGLLEKGESASFHHRNIQGLAIVMIQIKYSQSHEILTDIFTHVTQE